MTPTEVQIAQIVHSIVYNNVGSRLSMFNQTLALNSWMVTMGYKYDPDSYKYSNRCYQATYRNLKGRVVKVDYMCEFDDAANVAVIRDIIAAVINDPPTQQCESRTQQCSEYDDLLNIRKQCIRKEYIDNAVNDLAKVVTSLGRLIDWLNACGYTTQVNSDNEYEITYVVIKSPHSDSTCTYRYNTELRDIFRYVIIEDHVHSVTLRIAKFFTDNMVDRTKASLNFDEFAAQYGWKHQFLTDEDDTWGWVKNGILYPLPYRSGEYMDSYKHVIHEIVGHVQCEELRLV